MEFECLSLLETTLRYLETPAGAIRWDMDGLPSSSQRANKVNLPLIDQMKTIILAEQAQSTSYAGPWLHLSRQASKCRSKRDGESGRSCLAFTLE